MHRKHFEKENTVKNKKLTQNQTISGQLCWQREKDSKPNLGIVLNAYVRCQLTEFSCFCILPDRLSGLQICEELCLLENSFFFRFSTDLVAVIIISKGFRYIKGDRMRIRFPQHYNLLRFGCRTLRHEIDHHRYK